MNLRILGVLLLVLAPQYVCAFDLNGVHLGDREAQVRAQLPAARCFVPTRTTFVDYACEIQAPLGGVSVSMLFSLKDGGVVSMSAHFPPEQFQPIREALVAKFGKPDAERSWPTEEWPGLTQTSLAWANRGQSLTVKRYGLRREYGVLLINGPE